MMWPVSQVIYDLGGILVTKRLCENYKLTTGMSVNSLLTCRPFQIKILLILWFLFNPFNHKTILLK